MAYFESTFVHQDVLAICSYSSFLLSGVGGRLYLYKSSNFLFSKTIFQGQKIHLIKAGKEENTIVVIGGKHLSLCRFSDSNLEVEVAIKCCDWILDAEFINESNLILITSHNQVQLWDLKKKILEKERSSTERCVLYSAKIHKSNEKWFILAGTVFSEVIVWQADFESTNHVTPILYRCKGHKGVIFSIDVGQSSSYPVVISTTSDDRTIRLVTGDHFEDGLSLLNRSPLFGHTGRVWKALLLYEVFLTIGEDSLLCAWTYEGSLLSKTEIHQGGGIRSLAYRNDPDSIITGGSDGGILNTLPNAVFSFPESVLLIDDLLKNEIPRKVKFFGCWGIVCQTDNQLFYRKDHGPLTKIGLEKKDQFKKCTDLAVSCDGRFIGITTVYGEVIIYNVLSDAKPLKINVGNGKICESLRWRNNFVLVQLQHGIAKLFLITPEYPTLTAVTTFLIPKSKERSATCFLRLPADVCDMTLLGDRSGNLHVYDDNDELPLQTFKRLHSFLGLSDISYKSESRTVLTVGSGGWVKVLGIFNRELRILRSFSIPMEAAVRTLFTQYGTIIAGFQGSYLKLWNCERRNVIANFKCGGGNRSFDFKVVKDQIQFIYIKDKQVFYVYFGLKFGHEIRNGYHTKVINCLKVLDTRKEPIVVSGGDDNTLRIVQFSKHDLKSLYILEKHISNIRALYVHPLTSEKRLIVAAGGREQISLTEFDLLTQDCREILSHFPDKSPAEGRYMCLEMLTLQNGNILILVGCSDCTLKIFLYKDELELVGFIRYTHCILQVIVKRNFVVTFGTDGKGVFWDLTDFLVRGGPLPLTPDTVIPLHQSGINSVITMNRTENEFILVTGGDDNLISMVVMRLANQEKSPKWEVVSEWGTSASHSCQITGLMQHENWLISTSVDQRVVLHSLMEGGIKAKWVSDVIVAVPDAHGLAILSTTSQRVTICVYGKGIEVVDINFNPKM